LIKSLRSALC